jgi:hypothetical protein
MLAVGDFRITDRSLNQLKQDGEAKLPAEVIESLNSKDRKGTFLVKGKKFRTDRTYADALNTIKQDFAEAVNQAKADLEWYRYEEKVLQARLKQGQDGGATEQAEKALERHRARKKALQTRLQQAESDVKSLKDATIKDGELPPPLKRWVKGDKDISREQERFAAALEQVIKEATGLSGAGAARIRRWANRTFTGKEKLEDALARPTVLGPEEAARYGPAIEEVAYLFKVSPFWLILAYAIMTLGELLLSPMGLSLVSKVAPIRMRGLLMGGWFVATAIGNKLTMIGVYWEIWQQSTFFAVLGAMALAMGLVLLALLRPLKKSMPGV